MEKRVTENIIIENASIGFRNFSGKQTAVNREGDRNFCVFFDDLELADRLAADGWNMKQTKPRDPEDTPTPFLQVSMRFDNFPPKILLISSAGKTYLEEQDVNMLDWSEIKNVDLIINPYNWKNRDGSKGGVKAYLKEMYVTIVENPFEEKYLDVKPTLDIGNNVDY